MAELVRVPLSRRFNGVAMLDIALQAIDRAEELAAHDSLEFLEALRTIPFDDFGILLFEMPNNRYPSLSSRLPSMPSEELQRSWTGAAGRRLLDLSIAFVRLTDSASSRLADGSLRGKTILDYGCGWGRLMRLMLYYTNPELLFGCDPTETILDICKTHRVLGNVARSTVHPTVIPFENRRFDIALAYSVFTHTSARATDGALNAIRGRMVSDGLLIVTIRPLEYWKRIAVDKPFISVDRMHSDHMTSGFAFTPNNVPEVDGEKPYGHTSMTLEYLDSRPGWAVADHDHRLGDPNQMVVYLRPT
jgi:hypothetical protein